MPFPNIELPADFHVPCINDRSRDKRLANLRLGPGRVKGKQNKICRDLKEGLLEGAILHGYDGAGEDGLIGYCHHLAERHPKAYAMLLARLLPYNMNANVATAAINEVRIISVPNGSHLTKAAIDALEHDSTLQAVPPEADLLEPAHVEAPIAQQGEASSEEEDRIINNLKAEINELARKAGLSLVV